LGYGFLVFPVSKNNQYMNANDIRNAVRASMRRPWLPNGDVAIKMSERFWSLGSREECDSSLTPGLGCDALWSCGKISGIRATLTSAGSASNIGSGSAFMGVSQRTDIFIRHLNLVYT
jgi:hypothetical protein